MSQDEIDLSHEAFQDEEAELTRQLLSLRQAPSPTLQQHVQSIPSRKTTGSKLVTRLAWGLAILVAAGLWFVSPAAQATLGVERLIGQIRLTVLDTYQSPAATTIIESVPISVVQAEAILRGTIDLPTYLPEQLAGEPQVSMLKLTPPIVRMRWRDSEGGFVQLSIQAADSTRFSTQTLVGYDSSEPVLINDRPGVVVRGSWDAKSQTWRYQDQMTTLIWVADGRKYRLLAFSDVVSLAELLEIARSIK